MIRLSVSDLDSYLYWRDSEMSLDELVLRLKGQSEPTNEMLAGRAFHKIMENASEGQFDYLQADGYHFQFNLTAAIELPQLRELKCEHVMQTKFGAVTLVGRVDAINGNAVHDYKLTERFDAERYADSYQWRCYLMMFGARQFVYDVFQADYELDAVIVYDYHRMSLYGYEGMQDDVSREVTGLAEIVAKYVPEKVAA